MLQTPHSAWHVRARAGACGARAVPVCGCAHRGLRSPASLYATPTPEWSKSRLVAYTAFSRTVWALGLAVLCLLWFSAPGNAIARFVRASYWCVWSGGVESRAG